MAGRPRGAVGFTKRTFETELLRAMRRSKRTLADHAHWSLTTAREQGDYKSVAMILHIILKNLPEDPNATGGQMPLLVVERFAAQPELQIVDSSSSSGSISEGEYLEVDQPALQFDA